LHTEPTTATHQARGRAGAISKTAAYYLAFVALGITEAVLGPSLGDLAARTQSTLSQIGVLFTAGWLGYLFGALLGGRLYDRVNGHPVMAASLVVMAAALVLAPLTPLLWVLFSIFLMLGLAKATLDVGGNALLVWVHGDKVPPFMNGLHFFFGLGAMLTPLIMAQIVGRGADIRWAFWALAVLMLPVALWLMRLPSPQIQGATEDGPARPVDGRLLILVVVFFVFAVGAEVGFGGWIAIYSEIMGLASATGAKYLNSAFWGAFTVGRLLSIPIALRLRPSAIMSGGLAGCVASLVVILLWPESSTALWLGTVGMGLCIAPLFPTGISLVARRMAITGRVTGWFFVGASLGGMSLPLLMGQLFEPIGPQAAMLVILVDILLGLGVFIVIKLRFPRVA
jgi:FHS family Na+ dependent glucose MFS transporter 1